jgi:hypothetical protein
MSARRGWTALTLPRFMALNDLASDLSKNVLANQDEQSEAKLTRQVVALLADKNSEVKNQAVKWYYLPLIYLRYSHFT